MSDVPPYILWFLLKKMDKWLFPCWERVFFLLTARRLIWLVFS
jgi:hypothetical protein